MADKLGEGWEYRKEGKKEGEEREGRWWQEGRKGNGAVHQQKLPKVSACEQYHMLFYIIYGFSVLYVHQKNKHQNNTRSQWQNNANQQ